MAEKHKPFFGSQTYKDIKASKNYLNPGVGGGKPGMGAQSNQGIGSEPSYQKRTEPIGSSFSSAQYLKSYSSNIDHYYDRVDYLKDQRKQEEAALLGSVKEGAFELRCSVPVNYTKKPDTEFLRNTTLTPKPKGFYELEYNHKEKWTSLAGTEGQNNKPALSKLPYSPRFENYVKTEGYLKDWRNDKFKYQKQGKEVKEIKEVPTIPTVKDFKDVKEISRGNESKESKRQIESKPLPYSPASSNIIVPSPSSEDDQKLLKKKVLLSQFSVGRSLGVGKFAEVFLAKHNASGFVLVLKRLSKERIKEYQMESQVIEEIKIHAFLSHPNIVQFYGVFSDAKYIYLMLEYLESGTLFDYIGEKYYLEEKEAAFFLRQICGAVKYLHSKGIAHRDIKPENIIISYGLVKLCDFGWSARVLTSRKTYCGTFSYAPPEIHQRKQYDETVDLWCIGVLAYELLTNQVPFDHKDRKITIQKITNIDRNKMEFPQNITLRARDFIESLLRKNPEERLKAYKMLEHPFLKQYEEES